LFFFTLNIVNFLSPKAKIYFFAIFFHLFTLFFTFNQYLNFQFIFIHKLNSIYTAKVNQVTFVELVPYQTQTFTINIIFYYKNSSVRFEFGTMKYYEVRFGTVRVLRKFERITVLIINNFISISILFYFIIVDIKLIVLLKKIVKLNLKIEFNLIERPRVT